MTISKDQSIVAQVAAKIAADLTSGTNQPLGDTLDDWSAAFDVVKDKLFAVHNFTDDGVAYSTPAQQPSANYTIEQATQSLASNLGATPVQGGGIRVKGDQYGPLPDWLFAAAAEAGVTEVWDNRNDLGANGNRPHFKATTGGRDAASFWPPKAGGRR